MPESTTTTPAQPPQGTITVPSEVGPGADGQGNSNIPATTPTTAPAGEQQAPVGETQGETAAPLNVDDTSIPAEDAPTQAYQPTGNAGLDLGLQFIGNLGFGADHPAVKALAKGDFAPIEKALSGMGDRAAGYQPYLQVAKDYAKQELAKAEASSKETETAVVQAVGGTAQWNAIQKWASENADPQEKVQINAAFKAGPLVAAAMARQLAQVYAASGQATTATPTGLKNGAAGGTATTGALSPEQYRAEVAQLRAKHGWNLDQTPEYKQLQQRRKAYQGK